MNKRTIHYIDVSKMSEKELCNTLGLEYIPWYKSSLFWALALSFSLPSLLTLINIFGN
jgi:hypothetical protein